jgi:GT2 family glycosyltransferase
VASRVLVVLPTLGDRIDTFIESLDSVAAVREEVELTLVVVLPPKAVEATAIAKRYGAVIVDDPRSGLAGAMNAGLTARTTEEYYVGLGDDDLLRPGGIPLLLSMADRDPSIVVAYGACDYIDDASTVVGVNRSGELAHRILSWGPDLVPHPGTLISLDALAEVHGFDESRPHTMDLDAFLKLKKVGRFVSTKRSVSAFRWHADSLTVANRSTAVKEALDVKRSHLPRAVSSIAPLWLVPVAFATNVAGDVVSARSRSLRRRSDKKVSSTDAP